MPVLYKSSPHVTPIFSTSISRVSSLLTNPRYQSSSSSLSSTSIFLRLRSVQGSKSMDLEVLGRHALLFDDDATSAFVNSNDALVEWNSLLIDRYDVRHLLPTPLPPLKRRRHHSSVLPAEISELELELDQERFLDLPPPSDEQELDNGLEKADAAGYHTVAFSYGNPDGSADQKNADAGSDTAFHPPFPVPENLLNNLPPTEKLHQIIARTAMFVRKHGGQSEIILRVKQGDNPTFGFLMSDHHLHAYFRFLVDHQELLESDLDGKSEEEKKADNKDNRTGGVGGGGALSLLGSVYGSGEDEEGTNIDSSESQENDRKETSVPANTVVSHCSEGMVSSMNIAGNDEAIPKHLPPKEKAPVSKRNRVASTVKGGTASNLKKKGEDLGSLGAAMGKSQTSALPSTSKVKTLVLEPPSDLKRLVDKIVEFILKNGKEFEAVLVEQDNKHGRFPFLLPSNQYYPYYLQVLQKAQESKLTGKNLSSEKDGLDKRTASSNDAVSLGSSYHDMPYDSDRKEKFKMVLSKSKKDGQDHPSKPTQQQVGVSVDAAAAILQAATRGIRNPNLDILPRTSSNGFNHGLSSEGGQASSFQSLFSSQPHSSSQKSDPNGGPSVSVPVAKAIANTAALAAASEADSSEAHLTKEQKLKAERLKRAKMFAAIIKSGAAPLKTEPVRSLSVEPPESGFSGLGGLDGEALNLASKEREGSSVPVDVDASDKTEKPERKHSDTEHNERRSRRKYRSRSKKHEEEEDDDNYDHDGKEEDEKEDKRDRKHSRKKHRSHHSSHHSRDGHKHRKRQSSSKDQESRHRHKHGHSDDEHWDRRKRNKKSHSEREADLEEGEISTKSSDQSKASVAEGASREASVGLSNSHLDPRPPSQPSDTTQVSDDLRAKIRAMLLATL